ncbi:MAG: hypothetical protein ACI31C_00665 [Muribaculaceae bacterium]
MDHNFTKLIGDWLNTPESERDYTVGALYLLKLSGNKIMYANIVANIDRRHEIVEYQLQKYYNFRVKELTHAQVEEMQQKVDAIVEEHIPLAAEADTQRVGKRDDHDLLPDSIKALYVENLSLLQRMRELHLRLRSLSLENVTCPDSERYPFLKEMIALDKKLHSNWERYDHYVAPTDPTAKAAATPSSSQTLRSAKNKAVSRKKSATK